MEPDSRDSESDTVAMDPPVSNGPVETEKREQGSRDSGSDTVAVGAGGPSERVSTEQEEQEEQEYILAKVRERLRDARSSANRVGRYTVLEELGHGGMGTVYAAYDDRLDRKIAIKVMRTDRMEGEENQQRLVREAQAMARLSHPNVATVHEVGEEDGVVFVAMEFVHGHSVHAWLQSEPAWPQVLEAFVHAGRGLLAAHQAGLVHRDFKPANVMRTDGGIVKVLDFGLARGLETPPTELTQSWRSATSQSSLSSALTIEGTIMGTPAYMAPEQHRGRPTDARTDQYGFCVAVWQGLAGARPFEAADLTALFEAKLGGPPSWPSTAPAVPRSVMEALKRGLSADPGDRWPSMEPLLAALSWDPSRRRRRWLLGLASVGVLGLGAVTARTWAGTEVHRCTGAEQQLVGIWDEARSTEVREAIVGLDRPYAAVVWDQTQEDLDAYARDFVAMHTEACEASTVRGEQSPRMLDLRMTCLHRATLDLRATVDTLADADTEVVRNAHELVRGLPPLSRCEDTEALTAEVEPPRPEEADAVEAIRAGLSRARSSKQAGRYERAWQIVETTKEQLEAVEYGPIRAEVMWLEGDVLAALGKYEEAETVLKEALKLASEHGQHELMVQTGQTLMQVVGNHQQRAQEALAYWPMVEGLSIEQPQLVVSSRVRFARVLQVQEKLEQAEAEYRTALSTLEDEPDSIEAASVRGSLAGVLRARGRYEEAEAVYRATLAVYEDLLGAEHPSVASTRRNIGTVLTDRGRYEEAEVEFRAALSIYEASLDPEHPDLANARNSLTYALRSQGKYEEAEVLLRMVVSSRDKTLGVHHPRVAAARSNLALILMRQGKYGEAEQEFRLARSMLEQTPDPEHSRIAVLQLNYAALLIKRGRLEEAETELRESQSKLTRALGPDHPNTLATRINLGSVLSGRGEHEAAEEEFRALLPQVRQAMGPEHPNVTEVLMGLTGALLELGRADEALPLAEQAWARRQADDTPIQRRVGAAFLLARALWDANRPDRDRPRARALAEDALRWTRQDDERAYAGGLEQWLETHRIR